MEKSSAAEKKGEEGERSGGGNRWPREETMALLRIRSEMDAAFRDISPKGPLWDQVSRKLADLGFDRNAKKCKEKFDNIHKYYRRTKQGRSATGNHSAKAYRFFEQLEALNPHPTTNTNVIQDAVPCSVRFPDYSFSTSSATTTTSSSSGGGEGKKAKRKKRLAHLFEGLMMQVIRKQETLQTKFLEVLEKCEQDRMAREQAWKTQELARIQRERDLLAQERSIAAAKDEAVLAFLNKFAQNNGTLLHLPHPPPPLTPHHKDKDKDEDANVNNGGGRVVDMDKDKDKEDKQECGNGNITVGNFVHMSSSRWPKDEVEALIRLRTQLEGNGGGSSSKGPLWEEISWAMKGLGYDRSAKRCKEKWENINKYFKRMREKNKRKPEDSKTCPYYHHLEALYNKKPKNNRNNDNKVDQSGGASANELKPEELLMHIMGSGGQEETQHQQQQQQVESSSEDNADRQNSNMDQNLQDQGDNEEGYHQMVENSPSIAIMG